MNISYRLDKIVRTIRPCSCLADIGCDHGYVTISALKQNKAESAVAADVAEGPLSIAEKNCRAEGVAERTRLLLSDGFRELPDEADINCAVIAGMGGLLMERILREGRLHRFRNLKQLVLSPQSDPDAVRRFVMTKLNAEIASEYVVLDEGKYYCILDVSMNAAAETEYTEAEYLYGRHIAEESWQTYADFLMHRRHNAEEALSRAKLGSSDKAAAKAAELVKELNYISERLNTFKSAVKENTGK